LTCHIVMNNLGLGMGIGETGFFTTPSCVIGVR
jgi:hypothetical protein